MSPKPVLVVAVATVVAACGAAPPKLTPMPLPDSRELPHYMVPVKQDAAEAYWSPDSRYLIAQTKDRDAVATARAVAT